MAGEAHRIEPQRLDPHLGTAIPPSFGEAVSVRVEVRDPEVLAELRRYPEGPQRDEFLRLALRIGVLSLRMASGSLDLNAIKQESASLVQHLRQLLEDRQQQITASLAQILGEYLDPGKGKLEARLASLTRPGGELDSLLRSQLDGESSALARTLTAHVGEQSKLFRILSPEDAGGLRAQVQSVLEQALEAQRKQLLAQFSLDEPNSALKRLADTIQQENRKLGSEFSLDKPDSALSRMTQALEATQRSISQRLTLDDPQSPLSVLSRELEKRIEEIRARAEEFQSEVKRSLESLETRRRVEARSTLQGLSFEDAFARVLEDLVTGHGDILEDCRATTGSIARNKKGDFVARLSEDSGAPGTGIVWETKSSQGYTLKQALEEIAEARRNRDAQIGVFVWESSRAVTGLKPLQRYGSDLVLQWDSEDPATDIRIEAAYSIARALAVRAARHDAENEVSAEDVDKVADSLEQKMAQFAEMRTKTNTIASSASAVLRITDSLEDLVRVQIGQLRALSANMRQRAAG